jgi:thiamine-monophosphate kinase
VLACKLLRRSLSDLAAAGAKPWAVSWTLAAPPETSTAWLRRLARAFLVEAEHFNLPVVGGDCSRARALVLTCSILGLEARGGTPGRGGAEAGDVLFVTGRLGGAVTSGRHLLPQPRLREGVRLAERFRATAMMDLSDGLARDLPRLLARSGIGARVHLDRLPVSPELHGRKDAVERALGEGEDYELLVALHPAQAARARRDPLLRRCGLTEIGLITRRHGLRWLQHGRAQKIRAQGYSHNWS